MLFGHRYSDLSNMDYIDNNLSTITNPNEMQSEAEVLAYRILNDLLFNIEEINEFYDEIKSNPDYLNALTTNENPVKEFFENDIFEQVEKEKIEITPQQKQQAQQLYSKYIEQTGKQDVEGFKKFVAGQGKTMLQKEGTELSKASPKTIALVKDFLKRIGVDVKSMQEIVVNGKRQNANGVALIMQKLVQVVEGKEAEALPEEAMHFAVEIIKQTNPKLYNQLLKEINNYALYKQVLADYSTDPNYQTKDGKPNIQKLKEEAIGKVLAETIINKNEGTTEKPENLAKAQSWWASMLEWFQLTPYQ